MVHSLERLTDRERDLLGLLAQGHTAKTIANSQGLSVNVVNERLRSARRKTDAPSSRELARIIARQETGASQENRNKFLGLETSPAVAHPARHQDFAVGARAALTTWRITMILGVLIAAGMLAYQTNTPLLHGSSAFDNLVVLSPDAGVLRANLQAEVRDERWASRAETRLRANFQEINAEVRTVKCGETLCEAVGTIARPETVPALGAVRLESRDGEQASALQLVRTDASAGSGSEQDRFVVTSYWRRTD